ncbi:MAG: hypothetical protein KGM46_03035, partial [Pseudomonadota bacterium]|nr:hypothetical protein [Pseudomonadota bacterium]
MRDARRWLWAGARLASARCRAGALLQWSITCQPELFMDTSRLSRFVSELWDAEIVPQLVEYIR